MERIRCFEGRSVLFSCRCLNGSKGSQSHTLFPLQCLQRMLRHKVVFKVFKVQCPVTAEIYVASKLQPTEWPTYPLQTGILQCSYTFCLFSFLKEKNSLLLQIGWNFWIFCPGERKKHILHACCSASTALQRKKKQLSISIKNSFFLNGTHSHEANRRCPAVAWKTQLDQT